MNACKTIINLSKQYRESEPVDGLRIKLAAKLLAGRIHKDLRFNLEETSQEQLVFSIAYKGGDYIFKVKGDTITQETGNESTEVNKLVSDIFIRLVTQEI